MRNESIRRKKIWALTFLIMLSIPMLFFNYMPAWISIPDENRALAEFPGIPATFEDIKKFPKRFDEYVADNFGFRKLLSGLYSNLKYYILESENAKRVLVGKEGWLFLNSKWINLDYLQLTILPKSELRRWRILLEERADWLSQQNIEFAVAIAPVKQSVYPEYMPDWFGQSGSNTKLDQFLGYMGEHSSLGIISFRDVLKEKKVHGRLYYKTDTHWNFLGALFGYQEIAAAFPNYFLENEVLSLTNMNSAHEPKATNLYRMMGVGGEESVRRYAPKEGWKAKRYNADTPRLKKMAKKGAVSVFENKLQPTYPKLLVLGDSFLGWNSQYIAEHFSRTVNVNLWGSQWKNLQALPTELIKEEQPDLVLMQFVESRLKSCKIATCLSSNKGPTNRMEVRQARLSNLFKYHDHGEESIVHPIAITSNKKAEVYEFGNWTGEGRDIWIMEATIETDEEGYAIASSPGREKDKCKKYNEVKKARLDSGVNKIYLCVSGNLDEYPLKLKIGTDGVSSLKGNVIIRPYPEKELK